MNKTELSKFALQTFGENISFRLQTKGGKWYEQVFTESFTNIEPNKIYGCIIDNTIMFDFKTGSNEDTFLKSFTTQFINKYELKKSVINESGEIVKQTKEAAIKAIKSRNRVDNGFYYTTLYGIGCFVFFTSDKGISEISNTMGNYLKAKKISYKNEFSEARWVYRFVINQKVELHNELLRNYTN